MTDKEKWHEIFIVDCDEGLENYYNDLQSAFTTMLWYQGYDKAIVEMLKKIKDTDEHIPYSDENGFSEEVWSVFVLMFGDYGTSPRVGWIEKIAEFKKFLEKILKDFHEIAPEYEEEIEQ